MGNLLPPVLVRRLIHNDDVPQVSWLFFKAVRAGLAVEASISGFIRIERATPKTANWPRPKGLR